MGGFPKKPKKGQFGLAVLLGKLFLNFREERVDCVF